MIKKGKVIVRKKSKGNKWICELVLENEKQPRGIQNDYEFTQDLNGKECEVEFEGGKIKRVTVEGINLVKKEKSNPPTNQQDRYNQRNQNYNRSSSHQTHSQSNRQENETMQDSIDISKTKLPKDIREDLKNHIKDIDNFALKLNKAARVEFNHEKKKEEFKFFYVDRRDKNKSFRIKPNFGNIKFEDLEKKMTSIKSSLKNQGYEIESLSMKPDWRLIVGLGNESVYETSMTLHHIYGIPYIPGSAVKGVVRSYIISECFSKNNQGELNLKEAENTALANKAFTYIFGDQEHQGNIIFFDVFPTELKEDSIKVDVMTPHYGDYYSGKTPPADYLSPNPIPFLTVKDTTFNFYLGIKEHKNNFNNISNEDIKIITPKDYNNKAKTPLSLAKDWLKAALKEHGIGAKTAVGYGYLSQK